MPDHSQALRIGILVLQSHVFAFYVFLDCPSDIRQHKVFHKSTQADPDMMKMMSLQWSSLLFLQPRGFRSYVLLDCLSDILLLPRKVLSQRTQDPSNMMQPMSMMEVEHGTRQQS